MSFQDLDEFFNPVLELPIRGKTYVIESPDAKTGLWVQGMMTAAAQIRAGATDINLGSLVLDDDEERDAIERVLGDTYQQMLDDGLRWHHIKHAGTTAMLWIVHGKETAERFWNAGGGQGKAPEPETTETPEPSSTANEGPPV